MNVDYPPEAEDFRSEVRAFLRRALPADWRGLGSLSSEQAREFTAAAGVTGIVLTKLDGTARGGIVVSIMRELNLPVLFVGTGESVDDLVPFNAQTFVNSLFD